MKSRKESFIGLATDKDLRMALHYQESFKILYTSNKYQDQIVIPALFMVRQFLELGLKYNIKILSSVSGSSNLLNDLSNIHNLDKLHCSFLEHYKNAKKNLKLSCLRDGNLLDDLKTLVNIIVPLDNNSMGFRYSNDKDGKKQIASDKTYNLENVYKLVENVSTLLSGTEEIFGLTE